MSKERILVVEDERIVAEDIRRNLTKMGYDVISIVDSGEKAIKEAVEKKPDLIFMDIILKGKMDGVDAADQIYSHLNIPIIFLTALTDEKTLERAKKTSPFGYIIKPFRDKDLQITIEIALYKSKMQKELSDSREMFHTTLKSIGDAVVVLDQKGKIVFMNPVSQRLTGWDMKEATGKPIDEIYKFPDKAIYERTEKKGTEATLIDRSGALVNIEDRFDRIIDENGNDVGSVLVFRDIRERKRLEDEQQERAMKESFINKLLDISINSDSTKEILEQILDHLITLPLIDSNFQGGIWIVENDPDILVLKAQRKLSMFVQTKCNRIPFGKCVCGRCALTGEIKYADHADAKHEITYNEISPHSHCCLPLVFSGKVNGILNLYFKEGKKRNPKEEEFLKTIADVIAGIIQRKKIETELKHSNEFMRTILDSINDAICIIDVQDHKIVGYNSVFQMGVGLDEKDIIGKHCYKLTHNNTQPCRPPDGLCALFETLRTGKPALVEHLHQDEYGKKKYLEVMTSPIRNDMGRIIKVVHSTRDITQRKLVEDHLKMANIDLKKADQIKTQFLSVISHELRTPLTPMNAQLQMMLAGYFGEVQEKQKKSLEMVLRNIERLDRLIGDVLDISKLESGVMKFNIVPASINEVIENAVDIMKIHALNKKMNIILKKEKMPAIVIDKDRITQVMLNLIHNALKFSDPGGIIEVELTSDAKNITIKVKDNGIGIRSEDIGKLFKPFQQLDSSYARKYEGTGLGLAICNGIVVNHGGKIWVESEFRKGSTFIVSIPYNNNNNIEEKKIEKIMLENKRTEV